MLFSASEIAVADPLCPSCSGTTAEGERACGTCGYSFEFAAKLLPYTAPELRKFIDYEGHLSREDIKVGQRALEKLREHFPQVTLCTCVARVPDGVSISEFGFWLFNQSVPNGPRLTERRLHSILLCVDPYRGEASLTLGYGLDPFVGDGALAACLSKIQKPLGAGDYGKAVSKLCAELRPVLARGFEQASGAYQRVLAEQREQRRLERVAAPDSHLPPRRPVRTTHDVNA